MANLLNIGSVALYVKNPNTGEYEYTSIYNLLDYANGDDTINVKDNLAFGASFDIIDDHLFIGCPYHEPLFDDKNVWQNNKIGSVFVFDIPTRTLIQTITPDNTPSEFSYLGNPFYITKKSNFGFDISTGTDFVVIGAPGFSTNVGTLDVDNSGRAYMYKWNGSAYELTYTFTPNTDIDGNRFGNYVDVKDDEVVIGTAPPSSASTIGYVKFYEINTSRDDIIRELTISNTHVNTSCSIKVNNGSIAVGTPYNDTVKIYKVDTDSSTLTYTVNDRLTSSFGVGRSIEFTDEYIISGCPTGYRKLGLVLRFTNIGQKYTLI